MLLKLKTQVIFSENDNHDIKMFTPERHALLIEQKLIAAVKKCIVTGYIVELATGAVVYQYFQFVFDEIGSTGKLLNGKASNLAMKTLSALNQVMEEEALKLQEWQMQIHTIQQDTVSSKIMRDEVWRQSKELETKLAAIKDVKSSAYRTAKKNLQASHDKSASFTTAMGMNEGGIAYAQAAFDKQNEIISDIQAKMNEVTIPQGEYERFDTFEQVVNYFDKYGNLTEVGIDWVLHKIVGNKQLSEIVSV